MPWENTSLAGDFFFVPPAAAARPATATLPPTALEHVARAERAHELLRQRQLDDAERQFQAPARDTHLEVALMGQEGLDQALLARGDAAARCSRPTTSSPARRRAAPPMSARRSRTGSRCRRC